MYIYKVVISDCSLACLNVLSYLELLDRFASNFEELERTKERSEHHEAPGF